jgi:hypothetical protein
MANDASLVVNVPFDAARVIIHSDRYDKDFAYTLSRGHDIIPLAEAEEEPGAAELESGRLRHLRSPKWKVSPDLPPHLSKWQHRYLSTFRLIMLGDVRRAPYHYFVPEEPLPPMDDAINASFEAQLQRYWARFYGPIQARVREAQQKGLVDILHYVLPSQRKETPPSPQAPRWQTAYRGMVTFLKRQNPQAKPCSKANFQKAYNTTPLLQRVIARIDQVERAVEGAMRPRTKLQELTQRMFGRSKTVE